MQKPQIELRSKLYLLPGIIGLQDAFMANPRMSPNEYLMAEIAWREFINEKRGEFLLRLTRPYPN
jgi:hypothetical protein